MRVVVDTNVWVSGLIVPESPPGRVLLAARTGRLAIVSSWDLADELAAVLRRPKLRRYAFEPADVESVLVLLAPSLPTVDVDVPIRDPDDAPVVAAAIAGGAGAIVTGESDLLADEALLAWLEARGIAVLTPAALCERLRS